MYRNRIGLVLLLLLLCMMAACSSRKDEAGVSSTDSIPLTRVHAAPESETAEQSNVEAESQVQPTMQTSDSSGNKIADIGFDTITKLELNGLYCAGFVAINTHEVIAAISSNGYDDIKLVRIELKSGEISVLQESSVDEQIVGYSLSQLDNGSVQWRTYSKNEPIDHMYQMDLQQQKVVRVDDIEKSPDGNWMATPTSDDSIQGIWGTELSSGNRKQWTTGAKDAIPLWLPDSSGFLFLHDTGDNLGDGAGPRYELAKYDLISNKITILPYESGFWGYIEWLEPGVSILAHNGFDDVVGLKIVNLETSKEYQLVDTSDFDYLSSRIIPVMNHLFISDQGAFKVYGPNGELKSNIPWPTGFDEYTNKRLAADRPSQTDEPVREVYYAGDEQSARFGPSNLSFSQDGKQLSYLLGAIGEGVDDKVEGTRIALANSDGSGTKLVTQNYARISSLQWSPDGTTILALFTSEEDRKQSYIGTIQITPTP
ncbi:hypothetical protein H8B09_11845 [Paenibacillus sp. PR3]|uniref:Uncharacterized protein n=1 Tax=Paenibacillus terricola TaxID=2763503 RepID=A0ABR8MWR7_9BACL|nr:hypothetical protein [Paenibacillus terricola]MBD3919447.1 hypothetical protein [Paenibacillus terricola]